MTHAESVELDNNRSWKEVVEPFFFIRDIRNGSFAFGLEVGWQVCPVVADQRLCLFKLIVWRRKIGIKPVQDNWAKEGKTVLDAETRGSNYLELKELDYKDGNHDTDWEAIKYLLGAIWDKWKCFEIRITQLLYCSDLINNHFNM